MTALQISRVCTWGSVVNDELCWKCWQISPHCLLVFSNLVASVSSDNTAAVPRTSYTESMNSCTLRKTKCSLSEASATHVLSGLCAEWDLCCRLGQGLHTTHINGSLRCLPSLLGLVLFYPKVYQEMPEPCLILWAESLWTFYKFILFRFSYILQDERFSCISYISPTLCQVIWTGAHFGIW